MTLHKPRFPTPFRRPRGRDEDEPVVAPPPEREPDDGRAAADGAEACWRASSYDLKHGLDVVELPTSLPADVLDRLFNAPPR